MKQPAVIVVSTYAEDTYFHRGCSEKLVREGGPAHWIERTYARLGVPHKLLTSGKKVTVSMELVNGEPLPGKVFEHNSRVEISAPIQADGFVVNVLDLTPIEILKHLEGTVLLDIAHFTRGGPFRQQRKAVALPDEIIREKITILKANEHELPAVPKEWVDEQKQHRILLHTLGAKPLKLWVKGLCHEFNAPELSPPDVLGAGDTLGAAFLYYFLTEQSPIIACEMALAEVERLFKEKIESLNSTSTKERGSENCNYRLRNGQRILRPSSSPG